MTFTIGCDPEIFITQNGEAVSAHGLIPGTKSEPFKIEGGAYQIDGTALEFNTDPVPYNAFSEWNEKIVVVMKELEKAVKAKGNYKFNISPVQEYNPEYLASLPDESKELGCDPDFCAYTLKENPRPDGDRPFRTGAGHIHVGWGANIPIENPEHHEICAGFIKMLDCTVGLLMVCMDRDPRRRELYGKAGAYRAKPYGVEYRYPSNVWIATKTRRKVVFNSIQRAVHYASSGHTVESLLRISEADLQKILNEGDVASATQLLHRRIGGTTSQYLSSMDYAAISAKYDKVGGE